MYKYECSKCNFHSNKLPDYTRHCSTLKHTKKVNSDNLICDKCNIPCSSRTTLWRHLKTCTGNTSTNLILKILEENKELKQMLMHQHDQHTNDIKLQQEQHSKEIRELIPRIGNTTNNRFNLNLFLNEKCKDAINWDDFMDTLHVNMDDIENSNITDCITKVICDGIQDLGVYKRPIHCTDTKRKKLCIKKENTWEQNECKVSDTLKKTAVHMQQKYLKLLQKWEENHPLWYENDRETEMYTILVSRFMGEVNEPKCVADITKNTTIPKIDV